MMIVEQLISVITIQKHRVNKIGDGEMIEVIVQNREEAIEAEAFGAGRVELVTGIEAGGLTPSYGTIKSVLNSVTIPVQVMIRPNGYSHCYSEEEKEVILEDIRIVSELGGNRIVMGGITKDHTIDEELLETIIQQQPDIDITFHRAFEELSSQKEGYNTLAQYPNVKRILTSGANQEGQERISQLQELVRYSEEGGPTIMPGSGLSLANIEDIHQAVLAEEYHFGKAVRVEDDFSNHFSKEVIRSVDHVLDWTR